MHDSRRGGRIAMRRRVHKESNAVSTEKRPRGRPPKYPPEEVRRRLIDAAIATLQSAGVESGLNAVTLDGAILDADVPRGMSYKIWREGDETPQDAFRKATVLDLLSIPAVAGLPATREFTSRELDLHRAELATSDTQKRRAIVIDLIRRVGEFNHLALAESANWRIYTALRAAAITRPQAETAVMDALVAGEDFLIREYAQFYEDMAATVGLSLRTDFEMNQFSAAAYSLNEGLALRLGTSYRRTDIQRVGTDGSSEPWTLFAIALEALVFHFFDWA